MLPIIICFMRLEWSNYFDEQQSPNQILKNGLYNNQNKTTYFLSSVHVYDSMFTDCSSSIGGAISFSGKRILIEFTTFSECEATSTNGGAIYASNCECILNCVCCFKCLTVDYGQFIITEYITNRNYIHQSSVCSVVEIKSGSYAPIDFISGKQECKSLNVSHYQVSFYSSLLLQSSTSTESIISYCSLSNNHATIDQCICFSNSDNSNYVIDSCNIINNIQDTTNFGTIYCVNTMMTIKNCCILSNSGENLFYSYSGSKITIINCTLPQSYNIYGSVITNNAIIDSPFINHLKLTAKEGYCYGEYESIQLPTCITQPQIRRTNCFPFVYRNRKQVYI